MLLCFLRGRRAALLYVVSSLRSSVLNPPSLPVPRPAAAAAAAFPERAARQPTSDASLQPTRTAAIDPSRLSVQGYVFDGVERRV